MLSKQPLLLCMLPSAHVEDSIVPSRRFEFDPTASRFERVRSVVNFPRGGLQESLDEQQSHILTLASAGRIIPTVTFTSSREAQCEYPP